MSSPYRESHHAPQAPIGALRWRYHVAQGARCTQIFLVGNITLLAAIGLSPSVLAVPVAVVWLATAAGIVIAIWMLTAGQSGRGVDWRGWLLRGSSPICLFVAAFLEFGMRRHAASFSCGALTVLTVAAYVARLSDVAGDERYATRLRRSIVGLAVALALLRVDLPLLGGIVPSHVGIVAWPPLATCFLLPWATWVLARLRVLLLGRERQWWFDTEMESPGEWVALLLHNDEHAEVLCVDETLGWFASEDQAAKWLEGSGYVPADRAIREGLVSKAPPEPGKQARRRKRVRTSATSPGPRLRVAPETPEPATEEALGDAMDELDEHALADEVHEAARPRRAAVRERQDPRD